MVELNIGFVGCGAAAKKYYLPFFKMNPDMCKNIFFVDLNKENAKELANNVGSSNYTDDYHKILNKVVGVIIAVPHNLHSSIALEFLRAKTHVLCEKPLAESFKDAKAMINESIKNNVTLTVNNTRRVYPNFMKVKEMLSDGVLGDIKSINYFEANKFEWESNTGFYNNPMISNRGILLDIGSHVLDLICWWLDAKPELNKYIDDSFGGPESLAYLEASSEKTSVKVFLNRLVDINNFFEIKGDSGSISGSVSELKYIILKSKSGKLKKLYNKKSTKSSSDLMKPIITNFINIILKNEKPLISASDVINSIELIEECYNNRSRFNMTCYENLREKLNVQ